MTAKPNKIRLADFRNNQLSRCVLLILHYSTFCVQSTIETNPRYRATNKMKLFLFGDIIYVEQVSVLRRFSKGQGAI